MLKDGWIVGLVRLLCEMLCNVTFGPKNINHHKIGIQAIFCLNQIQIFI